MTDIWSFVCSRIKECYFALSHMYSINFLFITQFKIKSKQEFISVNFFLRFPWKDPFFLQFANLTILRDEDGNWYKFRMHFFHEQFSVSCYFWMITIPVDIGPCYSTVRTPTTCPPNQYWCCTIKFSTLPNTIKS